MDIDTEKTKQKITSNVCAANSSRIKLANVPSLENYINSDQKPSKIKCFSPRKLSNKSSDFVDQYFNSRLLLQV